MNEKVCPKHQNPNSKSQKSNQSEIGSRISKAMASDHPKTTIAETLTDEEQLSENHLRKRRISNSKDNEKSMEYPNLGENTNFQKSRNLFQSGLLLTFSLYILHRMKFYNKVMHNDNDHIYLNVSLASTLLVLILKSYVEIIQGKIRKIRVEYRNFRQETHWILVLISIASVSAHMALMQSLGGFWKTVLILDVLFGYGVVIQMLLIVKDTRLQNLLLGVIFTWFLQEYNSL